MATFRILIPATLVALFSAGLNAGYHHGKSPEEKAAWESCKKESGFQKPENTENMTDEQKQEIKKAHMAMMECMKKAGFEKSAH